MRLFLRSFCPSARTHWQGIPAPHWQPCSAVHARSGWFSHTHPMPSADLAVGIIHHCISRIGRRLYSSIARLESSSLRRSPRLIMRTMRSPKNRVVSLGSPSSPVRSRTLHAMLNDCSKSSVSFMQDQLCSKRSVPYTGGRRPGEFSHRHRSAAVSFCLMRRMT